MLLELYYIIIIYCNHNLVMEWEKSLFYIDITLVCFGQLPQVFHSVAKVFCMLLCRCCDVLRCCQPSNLHGILVPRYDSDSSFNEGLIT